MTGPEHYKRAEELAHRGLDGDWGDHEHRVRQLAAAQVHATLALAAATAMGARGPDGGADGSASAYVYAPAGMHAADFSAWNEAAGVPS